MEPIDDFNSVMSSIFAMMQKIRESQERMEKNQILRSSVPNLISTNYDVEPLGIDEKLEGNTIHANGHIDVEQVSIGFTDLNVSVEVLSVPMVTEDEAIEDSSYHQGVTCSTPKCPSRCSIPEANSHFPIPTSPSLSGNGCVLLKTLFTDDFNCDSSSDKDGNNTISLESISHTRATIVVDSSTVSFHDFTLFRLNSSIHSMMSPWCFDPGILLRTHRSLFSCNPCAVMVKSGELITDGVATNHTVSDVNMSDSTMCIWTNFEPDSACSEQFYVSPWAIVSYFFSSYGRPPPEYDKDSVVKYSSLHTIRRHQSLSQVSDEVKDSMGVMFLNSAWYEYLVALDPYTCPCGDHSVQAFFLDDFVDNWDKAEETGVVSIVVPVSDMTFTILTFSLLNTNAYAQASPYAQLRSCKMLTHGGASSVLKGAFNCQLAILLFHIREGYEVHLGEHNEKNNQKIKDHSYVAGNMLNSYPCAHHSVVQNQSLKLISYLALDKAGRMLDMGFEAQLRKFVEQMDTKRGVDYLECWHSMNGFTATAIYGGKVQMQHERATSFLCFASARCICLWWFYIGTSRRYGNQNTFKCHTICIRVGLVSSILPLLSGVPNFVLANVLYVSNESVDMSDTLVHEMDWQRCYHCYRNTVLNRSSNIITDTICTQLWQSISAQINSLRVGICLGSSGWLTLMMHNNNAPHTVATAEFCIKALGLPEFCTTALCLQYVLPFIDLLNFAHSERSILDWQVSLRIVLCSTSTSPELYKENRGSVNTECSSLYWVSIKMQLSSRPLMPHLYIISFHPGFSSILLSALAGMCLYMLHNCNTCSSIYDKSEILLTLVAQSIEKCFCHMGHRVLLQELALHCLPVLTPTLLESHDILSQLTSHVFTVRQLTTSTVQLQPVAVRNGTHKFVCVAFTCGFLLASTNTETVTFLEPVSSIFASYCVGFLWLIAWILRHLMWSRSSRLFSSIIMYVFGAGLLRAHRWHLFATFHGIIETPQKYDIVFRLYFFAWFLVACVTVLRVGDYDYSRGSTSGADQGFAAQSYNAGTGTFHPLLDYGYGNGYIEVSGWDLCWFIGSHFRSPGRVDCRDTNRLLLENEGPVWASFPCILT